MLIIKTKPTSNSLRHQIKLSKNLLAKNNRIVKYLLLKKESCYGRSSMFGRITSWHKQRGVKRLYRRMDSINESKDSIVVGVFYDPNRSGLVSLNFDFKSKKFSFNLSASDLVTGSLVKVNSKSSSSELKLGSRTKLKNIPTGTIVHNVGKEFNSSSSYIKSAGTFGLLIQVDKSFVRIKLPSGEILKENVNSYASLGSVSNEKYNLICLAKAGRNRNLGRRPIVRGIAMNPVDHPHGGRTNGGCPSKTPWGLPTKCKFRLKRKKKIYGKI